MEFNGDILPERLMELRAEHNRTQEEVAAFLGMTRTGYSYYEKGRTKPDYSTIVKIAQWYGVNPNYILGTDDKKTPEPFGPGAQAILKAIELEDEEALFLLKRTLTFNGKEIPEPALKEILRYARFRLKEQAEEKGQH